MYCFELSGKFNKHGVVGDISPVCVRIHFVFSL